jgi:hypothetical protein
MCFDVNGRKLRLRDYVLWFKRISIITAVNEHGYITIKPIDADESTINLRIVIEKPINN